MGLFNRKPDPKLLEDTYFAGWRAGQKEAIGLRPEFTSIFFSKIRKNPNTLMYEIPAVTYQILKDQFLNTKTPSTKKRSISK